MVRSTGLSEVLSVGPVLDLALSKTLGHSDSAVSTLLLIPLNHRLLLVSHRYQFDIRHYLLVICWLSCFVHAALPCAKLVRLLALYPPGNMSSHLSIREGEATPKQHHHGEHANHLANQRGRLGHHVADYSKWDSEVL
ncbi:hypothetical protein B0H65DRAFT_443370 [Neurospora tetraspora]|uniref:Uncharacterized protein n=1 Tax=Neurospora tetraspora TaxID=94610 RepID=A0AAE0MR02_9PEZI|nr:hypothetical protein B0H65DRAFT_443370 [Neurospora tetraspora]